MCDPRFDPLMIPFWTRAHSDRTRPHSDGKFGRKKISFQNQLFPDDRIDSQSDHSIPTRRTIMTETLPARISRSLGFRGSDVFRDLQHEMDTLLSRFSRGWDGNELPGGFTTALDLSEVDDTIQAKTRRIAVKPR
jgi:hypothetical protein